MVDEDDTLDPSWTYRRPGDEPDATPGLLLVSSAAGPALVPIPVDGRPLTLGRGDLGGIPVDDPVMSRRHVEVSFADGAWRVTDLGSRNGTWLDGTRLERPVTTTTARLLRIGDALLGLVSDLRPFRGARVTVEDGVVVGPVLGRAWRQIARAAQSGDILHLTGESGTGKELAARHFHRSGRRADGPLVSVNCAAIPDSLAERLLFGARKGAFSGADADAEGHVQAAEGGTLFLDEIAEMDLGVQAKLLRVLESREVLPLGATRTRRVDFAFCSATHRDLRAEVAEGRLRQDFYYRVGNPHVALPPLRDRIEDIPWLVAGELRASGLSPHVAFLEECMLRPWPGNARELVSAVREAAGAAEEDGKGRMERDHLAPDAGRPVGAVPDPAADGAADDTPILEALRHARGNVSQAARLLGWHRTQLRRWLRQHDVDPRGPRAHGG